MQQLNEHTQMLQQVQTQILQEQQKRMLQTTKVAINNLSQHKPQEV
jgi:hypothetical protein